MGVVDDLGDVQKSDCGSDAVDLSDVADDFGCKKATRGFLVVPNVKIDGPPLGFVDGEGFGSQPRHDFKFSARPSRNGPECGSIKGPVKRESDKDRDHRPIIARQGWPGKR